MSFAAVAAAVRRRGLAPRGGFHPVPADGVPAADGRGPVATLLLVGFEGSDGWSAFADSAEARDPRADPLDRWSRRIVGTLAEELGASALFPFDGPPWLPFQTWARRADAVFVSPLRLLIHPDFGLWHSYRGALGFADRLDLPARPMRPDPCAACADRPCLSACPVGAFTAGGFDAMSCRSHLAGPAGLACHAGGCLARRACPVGARHAYGPARAGFHMGAFRTG